MAEKRDYYEILGINKGADDAAIKKAYRSLAKKYHPDINPGDAEAEKRFKEVNEAYEVLSDSDKRAKYDQYGHAAFDQSQYGGGGYGGGFGGFDADFDISDIFGSFFGGGGRSGGARRPTQGEDIGQRVFISFEEAAKGCKKEISYARIEKCPECKATGCAEGSSPVTCTKCGGRGTITTSQRTIFGMVQQQTTCDKCRGKGVTIDDPCSNCRGTGYIRINKKIEVNIPAGIDNGQQLNVRGQGSCSTNGGPSGDLIIEVSVKPHPIFKRKGADLYCDVPITFAEAALGAELEIPTLFGSVKYSLPAETQTGTSFTIREKGMPVINSKKSGDLIFKVVVETPRGLNEKQKQLLRDFSLACGKSNFKTKHGFFDKKSKDKDKK